MPVQPVYSMASYNMRAGPCFTGDSLIKMHDGQLKKVQDVKKGDLVATKDGRSTRIACVVKTYSKDGYNYVCTFKNGLKITPYHPLLDETDGVWKFPIDLVDPKLLATPAVYSFVVE